MGLKLFYDRIASDMKKYNLTESEVLYAWRVGMTATLECRQMIHENQRATSKRTYPERHGWHSPKRSGFWFMCCDCRLVHVIYHRLVKIGPSRYKIQWKVERDQRATNGARSRRYYRVDNRFLAWIMRLKKSRKKLNPGGKEA